MEIRIENIVSSSEKLSKYLPLDEIYKQNLKISKYVPKKFPGLSLRIKQFNVTMLLFKSGKINCTGAKSFEIIKKSYKFISELLKEHIKKKKIIFKIQNIVSLILFNFFINIYGFYQNENNSKNFSIDYDPEQFPGIIYKENNFITCLIFYSGKIVLTGAKKFLEIENAGKKLEKILKKYFIKKNI